MSDEEVRALERQAATDPAARRALWIARARAGDLSLPTAAVELLVTRLGLEDGACPHRTMHESLTYRCTACRRSGPTVAGALHAVADVLRNAVRDEDVSHSIGRGDRTCVLAVPDPEEDAFAVGVGRVRPDPSAPIHGSRRRYVDHGLPGPWDSVGTYFPDLDSPPVDHGRPPELRLTRYVLWSRRDLPDRVRLPWSLARDVCVEVFRLSTSPADPLVPPVSFQSRSVSEDYRRLRESFNEGEIRFPDGRAFAEELRRLSLSTSETALAIEEFGRAAGSFVCRECGHLIHATGRCGEHGDRGAPVGSDVRCNCQHGGP